MSCATSRKSTSDLQEEQIIVTRKFIGNFLEYYHTDPQLVGGADLIWIRTTVYSTFGRISAYGKTCRFYRGDKIYLRPTTSVPDNYGHWEYSIENDSSVSYKVSDYRFENNAFIKSRAL
jgi:hypothetical protein